MSRTGRIGSGDSWGSIGYADGSGPESSLEMPFSQGADPLDLSSLGSEVFTSEAGLNSPLTIGPQFSVFRVDVGSEGWINGLRAVPQIERLELAGKLTEGDLSQVAGICPMVQRLSIEEGEGIDAIQILGIAQQFPSLVRLEVCGMTGKNAEDVEGFLESIVMNNENIRFLVINGDGYALHSREIEL